MNGSVLIELGWPAKALSPNAREHYMTVGRFKKAAHDCAYWATKAIVPPCFALKPGRYAFVITAYPPDKRSRDDDNLIASMKPARDGIARALGIDDKYFDQRLQWGEPVKHGKVVIEVRP